VEDFIARGPAFIKLGQLLSTRTDILPLEYTSCFSRLQNNVPGFSGATAVQIIEKELGQPISALFSKFDMIPMSSASLGQTHRATVHGRDIVVKVQRPWLARRLERDLSSINKILRVFSWMDKNSDGVSRDWHKIYDELKNLLYKELNYELEAKNAIRFRELFSDICWIKVPEVKLFFSKLHKCSDSSLYFLQVLLNLSSSRVLTMEYVPGIPIDDTNGMQLNGIIPSEVAQRLITSYILQFCRNGFYRKFS
jgi:predicted unusual protein kinase regulating ubiquinone biosynthesis (AarF/ABC1/UbiB family)